MAALIMNLAHTYLDEDNMQLLQSAIYNKGEDAVTSSPLFNLNPPKILDNALCDFAYIVALRLLQTPPLKEPQRLFVAIHGLFAQLPTNGNKPCTPQCNNQIPY